MNKTWLFQNSITNYIQVEIFWNSGLCADLAFINSRVAWLDKFYL